MVNKKVIIIFGLGWQQAKYIKFLKKKKYYLIGIDQSPINFLKNDVDDLIIENIFDTEKIYLKLKSLNIKKPYKIISFLSDTCELAAYKLRKKYKLISDLYKKVEFAIDKEFQLKELKKNSVFCPKTFFLSTKDINKKKIVKFPIITKPVDSSGSRGVIKINNKKDLVKNISKSLKYSRKNRVLLQEYLPGQEYSVEGVFVDGFLKIALISKRYKKKFVSAKMILPVKLDEKEKKIFEKYLLKVCKVLKFKNCFFHAELINYKDKLYFIDIAPRVGGFLIDKLLLPNYVKSNISELYINFSLGEKNNQIKFKNKFVYSALIFIFNNKNSFFLKKKQNKFVSFYRLNALKNDNKHEFSDSSRKSMFYIKCENENNFLNNLKKIKNL